MSFDTSVTRARGEFLLQRQRVGENGVIGAVPGQAVRQHGFEQLRLKEQPAAGRTLAVIDRHRGRQREPAIDLLLASHRASARRESG